MHSQAFRLRPPTIKRGDTLLCKATQVPAKYVIKPAGDKVLVKTAGAEQQTTTGIVLPKVAQKKKTSGEVVAVATAKQVNVGDTVAYSTFSGTELTQDEEEYLIVKEADLIGVMTSENVADMQPLFDRVLVEVEKVSNTTDVGVLLNPAEVEQPTIGKVVAVGPGIEDDEGNKTPLKVQVGATVLYSRYAGTEFEEESGNKQKYIAIKESDIIGNLR